MRKTCRVPMLAEGGGKRARHHPRLPLLQAQPRLIHRAHRVGEGLDTLLDGPVIVGEGEPDVLLAPDHPLCDKTSPQRVEGIVHVYTACVAQVPASLILTHIHQHQPTPWY